MLPRARVRTPLRRGQLTPDMLFQIITAMSGERARVRHQAAEEVRRGEGEGVPGGPGEL